MWRGQGWPTSEGPMRFWRERGVLAAAWVMRSVRVRRVAASAGCTAGGAAATAAGGAGWGGTYASPSGAALAAGGWTVRGGAAAAWLAWAPFGGAWRG